MDRSYGIYMAEPEPQYKLYSTSYWPFINEEKESVSWAKSESVFWKADGQWYHNPLSIYFKCQRNVDQIASSISHVYHTVVQNEAHTLLVANPGFCAARHNTGHCGNVRKHLTECKCQDLDRKQYPQYRRIYEDSVIAKLMAIIGNSYNFNVRIAMFATGSLHGEECLLFKLIDTLKKDGCSGTIHISLIDTAYKASITASHQVFHMPNMAPQNWSQLLGGREDFKQFITDLSLCLPSNIKIEGNIFGSAEDYIFKANNFKECRHDLMIGADLDGTDEIMDYANTAARKDIFSPAIALVKRNDQSVVVPSVCFFNNNRQHCFRV